MKKPSPEAVQRYLPGADAEHHAPCLPPYLLQQHGEVGHEPQDAPIPDGHSDIGVTLNTYTHLGLEDATDELRRMEDLENARKEMEKNKEEKPVSQKMLRAI